MSVEIAILGVAVAKPKKTESQTAMCVCYGHETFV